MKFFGSGTRRLLALLVAVLLLSAPASAWAARKGKNDALLEKDTSKSYILPYAIVVLFVGLGVMLTARPTSRLDSPRRRVTDDEEE